MKFFSPSIIFVVFVSVAPSLHSASAQDTTRVSVGSGGIQGDKSSANPSISSDGRYVAFESTATNLVSGDTLHNQDIFVHDRQTGQTKRVSVDSGGLQADADSHDPCISSDGRFVALESAASNLVPGDTNGTWDIFVHDQLTGQMTRVSVNSGGLQGNSYSIDPSISSDGRFVAFTSDASDLVPGDTNGDEVFVHDRHTGLTTRVSVDSAGFQGNLESYYPNISSDGQFVVFQSNASNLVPGDTNNLDDVFTHDIQTGQTIRVSVNSGGQQGNNLSGKPSTSFDGRFVSFTSYASNLVPGDTNISTDAFVHDRQTGQTTRVSVDAGGVQGNSDSYDSSISMDGRFVVFSSSASNLVLSDTNTYTDIFLHDRETGQTTLVSVDSGGQQGNSLSGYFSSISSGGRFIAFESVASNLVLGDTNGCQDVLVRDRGPIGPSLAKAGACQGNMTLSISGASPSGLLALLHGSSGIYTKLNPPCAGVVLGLSRPALAALIPADGQGKAKLNFNASAGFCGRSVQAVDVTTCVATNVVVI